jgi:hypothetical protein
MGEARIRVGKANTRLAKAGISERFTIVEDERWQDEEILDPLAKNPQPVEWVRFHLDSPALSFGGWTFIGAVDVLQDADTGSTDYMARLAPGFDTGSLGGHQVTDLRCDHCGTLRQRNNVYLVKDETGTVKQVGKNCLQLFTGVHVAGLWAIGFEDELAHHLNGDEDQSLVGPAEQWTVRDVIGYALAFSEGGDKFKSRSYDYGTGDSTASTVSSALMMGGWGPYWARTPRHERPPLTPSDYADNGTVDQVIAAMRATTADNDYGDSIRKLAERNWIVPLKQVGLAASGVAVWNRARRDAVTAAKPLPEGHEGHVGQRSRNVSVTYTAATRIGSGYGYYDPDRYLYQFTTDDNHLLVWFTSERHIGEIGDSLILDFTPKEHTRYTRKDGKTVDQTVLLRVTIHANPAGSATEA